MDWLTPFFDDEGKRKPRTDPVFSTALQAMTLWINQMDIAKLQALRVLFSSEVIGSSRFTSGLKATLSICLLSNTNEGEICTNDQLTDIYNLLTPEVNRWMAEERLASTMKRETVDLSVCENFVLLVSTATASLCDDSIMRSILRLSILCLRASCVDSTHTQHSRRRIHLRRRKPNHRQPHRQWRRRAAARQPRRMR